MMNWTATNSADARNALILTTKSGTTFTLTDPVALDHFGSPRVRRQAERILSHLEDVVSDHLDFIDCVELAFRTSPVAIEATFYALHEEGDCEIQRAVNHVMAMLQRDRSMGSIEVKFDSHVWLFSPQHRLYKSGDAFYLHVGAVAGSARL